MSVPDCIPSAIIHTVHPENYTVKQQTAYLFGKENIQQAMVKKKSKWNQYGDTVKWHFCLSWGSSLQEGDMNIAGLI